jgi:hypothetical protein
VAALTREDGFIDELIGILLATLVGLLIIALIVPIQIGIQDTSAIHNAIELAAQSALPYEFPADNSEAYSTSTAVFHARLAGLQQVNCQPLAITEPSTGVGNHYTVSADCAITLPFIGVTYHDSSQYTASVNTSQYQGVSP